MRQYLLIISVILCLNRGYAHNLFERNSDIVSITYRVDDKNKDIVIYPNPARDNVFIKNDSQKKISTVVFYSLLGTPVLIQNIKSSYNNKVELNISNLKKGKYIVKVIFLDGSFEVKSLIKQ